MNHRMITLILVAAALLLFFTAGCTATTEEKAEASAPASSAAADAYSRGIAEYAAGNYHTAEALFEEAYSGYMALGDAKNTPAARNGLLQAKIMLIEYPLNRSAAEAAIQEKVPGITDKNMSAWLDTYPQKIVCENETMFYSDIASDYLYSHFDEMQKQSSKMLDFNRMAQYAWAARQPASAGPYVNPIRYAGVERLEIPGDVIPATGVIRIWYPLPVETDSQRNITVSNLSYPDYIVKGPITKGPIGYVYYEIPAEKIAGDLIVTADISFTSYEQQFNVDPALVGEYNTSDPEYQLYTRSERNIEITDAIRNKAREIVGNETNPYLQAQLIYSHIITTYPYSHVPHFALDMLEPHVAESTYMFETGHGDCGTQSMLFSAFCRSLGIPARAAGGYQMLLADAPGTHFWAEYYIPGYGWIPNDTTVAEGGDWFVVSEEKRAAYKAYYAHNLDPARLIFQKNVDVPMDPEIPGDAPLFRMVRQQPAVVCDTGSIELLISGLDGFVVSLEAVDQ